MLKVWTKDEVADRMVDGQIVKLTDQEKQEIADERTANEIDHEQREKAELRDALIRKRMDKILREQAEIELRGEGLI